jgi:choline kinase
MESRPSYRDKYTIIIPAAGLGKRMKIYGPKSLVKINDDHTILSNQIEIINSCFRHCEIIVVGGYQYDKLESAAKNVRFVYNSDYETTNVLHSIAMGLKKSKTNKVLVIYGDLVFNKECIDLPFLKESAVVVSSIMKDEEVGCIYNDGILESVFYRIPTKWAQIAFFTGRELDLLNSIAKQENNMYWFGFEAINEIINKGGIFKVFEPEEGRAVDIDSSYDLKLLEKI